MIVEGKQSWRLKIPETDETSLFVCSDSVGPGVSMKPVGWIWGRDRNGIGGRLSLQFVDVYVANTCAKCGEIERDNLHLLSAEKDKRHI